MNEALENENFKDWYILSDLRSGRFKNMRWEVNHGVSGYRYIYIYIYIYILCVIYYITEVVK